MGAVKLNGEMLKEIGHRNTTTETLALYYAGRERMRHSSDYERLLTEMKRNNYKIVDKDFYSFFQELEAKDLGCFIYGRKLNDQNGKEYITPDKFHFYYNFKSLGVSMISGADIEVEEKTPVSATINEESYTTTVKLRKAPHNLIAETPFVVVEAIQQTGEEEMPRPVGSKNRKPRSTKVSVSAEQIRPGRLVYIFLPSGKEVDFTIPEGLNETDKAAFSRAIMQATQQV